MEKSFFCANEQQVIALGINIGKLLQQGDFICLEGNLGAGKTTLSKAIAQGMGFLPEDVTSPTFTIMNTYEGNLNLYHFDLYRLTDIEELEMIGFYEYIDSDGIALVEWSNLFQQAMPEERLVVSLSVTGSGRNVQIKSFGTRYDQLFKEVDLVNFSS